MATITLRLALSCALGATMLIGVAHAQVDPGVRGGAPAAGLPLSGLTSNQTAFFNVGKDDFAEAETTDDGIGPRFNLDSCVGCHSQPAAGGTAPAVNPQVGVATSFGMRNVVPSFITLDGPVREARFKFAPDGTRDGGVHALFTITGRADGTADTSQCVLQQDDFAGQVARNNVIFRIPTPVFGAGLIEQIPDSALIANLNANATAKALLLIKGKLNRNGNDGTVSRFGWKAQNQSLLLFSGEAYNVEMGITNELFQAEREQNPACQFARTPNDITGFDDPSPPGSAGGEDKFAFFMRFLAPPTPSTTLPGGSASISRGRAAFDATGCDNCHTPTLRTGPSTVEALNDKPVNLFSDLALHAMGPGLADDVLQGAARGDEFRTAPLWGLGQRVFFLHDGRTNDLRQAIAAHRSVANSQFPASEANRTIDRYNALSAGTKQDILNFLRSL